MDRQNETPKHPKPERFHLLHFLGSSLLFLTSFDFDEPRTFVMGLDPVTKYGFIVLSLVMADGFRDLMRAAILSARRFRIDYRILNKAQKSRYTDHDREETPMVSAPQSNDIQTNGYGRSH